jgi:hypothetical protein
VNKGRELHRRLELRRLDERGELLLRHTDRAPPDAEPVMEEHAAGAEDVDLGGTHPQALGDLLDG